MTPQRWRQLQALFDAALNEAPEEREAFLEKACAGDLELLAEVHGLLVQQMKAERDDFLPSLTVPGSTPSPTITPGLASRLHLAGYEVIEELGRGGMGVVYGARQVRLNRQVALKVILAGGHAGPRDLARFRAEAQILASLQHPNIVQIYDVGEHDGHPFFAMELMHGGSLKDRLGGAPLPPDQSAHLLLDLARAVEAAHRCGIVHRDLKPANVLLVGSPRLSAPSPLVGEGEPDTPPSPSSPSLGEGGGRGEGWVPKVADFSLAKRLGAEGYLTHTGGVLGTPSYMAPEQTSGDNKTVGPTTDIYALGAVLYECLTGRPPFLGATALDTIQQLQHLDPPRPRHFQPRVPRDLEVICLKCLEKDPSRRYASAAELVEDLRRFLHGEAIHARPASARERVLKWVRRHPSMVVSMVCATILLADFAGHLWQSRQEFNVLEGMHEKAVKVNEVWLKQVASLPARQQVEEVVARLRRLNPGFDGKETHEIEDGVVTVLRIRSDDVADLSPVRALVKLNVLKCGGSPEGARKLADLSPLQGMSLTQLWCDYSKVSDLTPLKNMQLTKLNVGTTRVRDLKPLKGMKLTDLNLSSTMVYDLTPLEGMPLEELWCNETAVSDLSPLKDMKLTWLNCGGSQNLSDLTPLQNMKLKFLNCGGTRVSDLSPLKSMKLTVLRCGNLPLTDLTPLENMKLTELNCWNSPVSDLSPLKDMKLTLLDCDHTKVSDLSPLRNMKLSVLICGTTKVFDLSPLKDMKLTRLIFGNTPVSDLAPLKDMNLTHLGCNTTRVSDLLPLKGMNLTYLDCWSTEVSDLSPLKDMRLEELYCHNTKISDLTPLQGMPLKILACDIRPVRDDAILRSINTLERINDIPAAVYWKKVTAARFP